MKTCTKCHIEKDESEFYKRTSGSLFSECKKCNNERGKKYKKENWVNVDLKHKEWIKNNPDKVKGYEKKKRYKHADRIRKYLKGYRRLYDKTPKRKEYLRSYVVNNRIRINERCRISQRKRYHAPDGIVKNRMKKYLNDNKDKKYTWDKNYRIKNRDKILRMKAAYFQRNKQKHYATVREWLKKNPDKAKLYSKRYGRRNRSEARDAYIRSNLRKSGIPDGLIKNKKFLEIKRGLLLIKRKLKNNDYAN